MKYFVRFTNLTTMIIMEQEVTRNGLFGACEAYRYMRDKTRRLGLREKGDEWKIELWEKGAE